MKQIDGYPDYCITEDGRVWSQKTSKWLKPGNGKSGALQIGLRRDGKPKTFTIARLVAVVYVDNFHCHDKVIHIDGNHCNNHYSNLQWGSSKDVMHNPKVRSAHLSKVALLNEGQVTEIYNCPRLRGSVAQLAKQYGVTRQTIHAIRMGKSWSKT